MDLEGKTGMLRCGAPTTHLSRPLLDRIIPPALIDIGELLWPSRRDHIPASTAVWFTSLHINHRVRASTLGTEASRASVAVYESILLPRRRACAYKTGTTVLRKLLPHTAVDAPPCCHLHLFSTTVSEEQRLPKMTIDHSKPYLRFSVDIGTTKLSGHTQHVHSSYTAKTAPIREVLLKPDEAANLKQVAILERDGNVIYGAKDVHEHLLQNPQAANRTLRLWKMNMLPHFQRHKQVRHNRRILHGEKDAGYMRDFQADHLRVIIKDVRSFYKRDCPSDDPEELSQYSTYIDSLPIELVIPVPVMMNDNGRADLRMAAKRAGATDVELREEPLCVSTCYILELVEHGLIAEGQCVLIVDVGGGTADVATVMVVELPTPANGGSLVLQRIGLCTGNDGGAHCLEAQAEKWVQRQPWFKDKCNRLQISEYNFLCQMSKGMESVKQDFYNERQLYTITINSSHGTDGDPLLDYEISLRLPRTTIQTWYDTWVHKGRDLLRDHLSTRQDQPYARAVLTGGGSQSAFFRSEITHFLLQQYNIRTPHSVTVTLACSKGALTQHMFQEDLLPDPCHWYIAQGEEYNKSLHRDAKRRPALRDSAFVEGEVVVHDRLVRLMTYTARTGFRSREPLMQTFVVEIKPLGRLHMAIYWSTDKPRLEHSSVYNSHDKQHEGLRSCPVMFDLPDLRLHNFALRNDGGIPHFLILAFVEMRGDASSLRIDAAIMAPTFRQTDNFDERKVWRTFTQEIWTPSSSPFVSQSTGMTGARSHSGYQSPQRRPATGESRSSRLRSVSGFVSDYGSVNSSESETDEPSEVDATHDESTHIDLRVGVAGPSKKRPLEGQQSSSGRRKSDRPLVRQKRYAASQHSIRTKRHHATVTSARSPDSDSAGASPAEVSLHATSSSGLVPPPKLARSVHPAQTVYPSGIPDLVHSPRSASSSTARHSSSPRTLSARKGADTFALLRKVEE